MAAQLLRLRLELLGAALRFSGRQLLAAVLGLAAAVAVAVYVAGLRSAETADAATAVTITGSLVLCALFVGPPVFGVDDPMDPRRFAHLGISTGRLARGLALAAFVGIPALALVIIAIAQVVTWNRDGTSTAIALAALVLVVVTGVLLVRLATLVSAFGSTARRRTLVVLSAVVTAAVVVPGVVALIGAGGDAAALASTASVLGWTPLGAAFSAPAAAAAGFAGVAAAKLVLAVVYVAVLWVAWRALVGAVLERVEPRVIRIRRHGLGWFEVFPATATGVIAARTFTYWGRDPRYFVGLVVVPILPLLLVVPLVLAGFPTDVLALIPVPIAALFLGWSVHNDVAQDNTAIWLHVVSDTRGSADRLGRLLPVLLVGVPVVILGSLLSARIYDDGSLFLSMTGVSLGILFTALGLSSVISARFPYPAVQPGDSPFSSPQAAGSGSAVIQSLSLLLTVVLMVPALILATMGLLSGGVWPFASFVVGLSVGLIVLVAGVSGGGRVFERRATDLLALSMRN
jgi:ABC-2 type transport system permease protein